MEIKIPEVGESIYEALLVKWLKNDGDTVQKDDPLCEIETDKVTVDLNAEAGGTLKILVQEGATVKIGEVIGTIGESSAEERPPTERVATDKQAGESTRETGRQAVEHEQPISPAETEKSAESSGTSPAARRLAEEHDLKITDIRGTGKDGRVTIEDVLAHIDATRDKNEAKTAETATPPEKPAAENKPEKITKKPVEPQASRPEERITRKAMTPIRKRIAERLLAARQQTAMLTTFNEADMSRVIALRKAYKDEFQATHGVRLGFMSFFVKACVEALRQFPEVNGRIDGNDIVYQHFYDIGIAIGGEKGLVVPVIRDADQLHFAGIEKTIERFAEMVKTGKFNVSDLEGGTFTISNGGVYGSLLSTPILNPPQSAILGMHAIQERPVARQGEVVIRPMMYLALSYDHRIIDGRQSVAFLKRIKTLIEEPEKMLLEM